MDAKAHLLSLGWAGPGHALDSRPYKQKGHRGLAYDPNQSHNTGNGLVRPLLISQRRGNLGIGKKAHEPTAGNDWWLKGFESALGNIGKSESERSSGTATPVQVHAGKHGGLYGFFIRGQGMEGTMGLEPKNGKKRKSDALSEDDGAVKTTRDPAAEFAQVGAYMAVRDKDEKRKEKKEKLNALEEFAQATEYFEARSAERKHKKKRKSEMPDASAEGHDTPSAMTRDGRKKKKRKPEVDGAVTTTEETTNIERDETKEERRERRRRRKESKAAKEVVRMAAKENGIPGSEPADDDSAAKEARRAERKRRKAGKAMR